MDISDGVRVHLGGLDEAIGPLDFVVGSLALGVHHVIGREGIVADRFELRDLDDRLHDLVDRDERGCEVARVLRDSHVPDVVDSARLEEEGTRARRSSAFVHGALGHRGLEQHRDLAVSEQLQHLVAVGGIRSALVPQVRSEVAQVLQRRLDERLELFLLDLLARNAVPDFLAAYGVDDGVHEVGSLVVAQVRIRELARVLLDERLEAIGILRELGLGDNVGICPEHVPNGLERNLVALGVAAGVARGVGVIEVAELEGRQHVEDGTVQIAGIHEVREVLAVDPAHVDRTALSLAGVHLRGDQVHDVDRVRGHGQVPFDAEVLDARADDLVHPRAHVSARHHVDVDRLALGRLKHGIPVLDRRDSFGTRGSACVRTCARARSRARSRRRAATRKADRPRSTYTHDASHREKLPTAQTVLHPVFRHKLPFPCDLPRLILAFA